MSPKLKEEILNGMKGTMLGGFAEFTATGEVIDLTLKKVMERIDERINVLEHGTEFKQSKVTIKYNQKRELEELKKEITL